MLLVPRAHLDVLGGEGVVGLVGLELAVLAEGGQRLKGQVGADGVRAVADQHAEVVHVAHLSQRTNSSQVCNLAPAGEGRYKY